MRIWLSPITCKTDFFRPLCSVITRIESVCVAAEFNSENLQQVTFTAPLIHDNTSRGWQDLNSYADDIRRLEFYRLEFPTLYGKWMEELQEQTGEPIEWCLPFLDADIYYADYCKGLEEIGKFPPNLHCFMVFDDKADPLVGRFTARNRFSVVTPQELNKETIGFAKRFRRPEYYIDRLGCRRYSTDSF